MLEDKIHSFQQTSKIKANIKDIAVFCLFIRSDCHWIYWFIPVSCLAFSIKQHCLPTVGLLREPKYILHILSNLNMYL